MNHLFLEWAVFMANQSATIGPGFLRFVHQLIPDHPDEHAAAMQFGIAYRDYQHWVR